MPHDIQAVIFDLGSTLIYFDGIWPEVMEAANQGLLNHLIQQGIQVDEQPFLDEFRSRLDEYYAQRETEFIEYTTAHILSSLLADLGYADVSKNVLTPALEKLYAVTQTHWKVEEDAKPTLQLLREQGYRMGILSNAADDADVQALVDKAGVRPYMDFVLSSAACGIRKPNPRIFDMALEHWNFAPEQVAMVGDTLGADILGAKNAGLFSIWLTRHAEKAANRDHLDTIRPDASVASLADLPALLKEIENKGD